MKNILVISLIFLSSFITAQNIPAETFKNHMLTISENSEILKKYKVQDQDGNPVFYINLGKYDEYHQEAALQNRNGEVFLWNEGAIFFYDVPYALDLLRIREEGDNMVFYEFVYTTKESKQYIEAKFVKRNEKWEFVDLAITKVKQAY